jgi:hypothetical protein
LIALSWLGSLTVCSIDLSQTRIRKKIGSIQVSVKPFYLLLDRRNRKDPVPSPCMQHSSAYLRQAATSTGKAAFRSVCLDVRKAATDRANRVPPAASQRPFYEARMTWALLADTRAEHRNIVDLHDKNFRRYFLSHRMATVYLFFNKNTVKLTHASPTATNRLIDANICSVTVRHFEIPVLKSKLL